MAKKYGVTLRTLRFYEDKGLLSPQRDGDTRLYTHRDRARLKLILLGRKVGFSLRDVKQMIDLYDPSGSNAKQLRLTLDKSEKQLDAPAEAAPGHRRGDQRTDRRHVDRAPDAGRAAPDAVGRRRLSRRGRRLRPSCRERARTFARLFRCARA